MTHHKRPGGRGLELLLLLLLLVSTAAIVIGTVVIVGWLGVGAGSASLALGIALSAPLWLAFLRYYKYEAHSLKPIIKEDDPK